MREAALRTCLIGPPSWAWERRRPRLSTTRVRVNPPTIVWLGESKYRGETAGMRVVTGPDVWADAVSDETAARGH